MDTRCRENTWIQPICVPNNIREAKEAVVYIAIDRPKTFMSFHTH